MRRSEGSVPPCLPCLHLFIFIRVSVCVLFFVLSEWGCFCEPISKWTVTLIRQNNGIFKGHVTKVFLGPHIFQPVELGGVLVHLPPQIVLGPTNHRVLLSLRQMKEMNNVLHFWRGRICGDIGNIFEVGNVLRKTLVTISGFLSTFEFLVELKFSYHSLPHWIYGNQPQHTSKTILTRIYLAFCRSTSYPTYFYLETWPECYKMTFACVCSSPFNLLHLWFVISFLVCVWWWWWTIMISMCLGGRRRVYSADLPNSTSNRFGPNNLVNWIIKGISRKWNESSHSLSLYCSKIPVQTFATDLVRN